MLIFSPLEQFEIITLVPFNYLGLNISLTNSSIFLIFSFFTVVLLFSFALYQINLVPHYWQYSIEIIYSLVSSMVQDNLGSKGQIYFPFIFVLNIFLLACNLIGMIPYTFTVTSHIVFTFSLALSIFIGINIIGVQVHGIKFFSIFLPRNVPLIIVPLLVIIEFVSYIVKVFTLSIRLFANMTSGHTLLKIIASFAWIMLASDGLLYIFHILPLGLLLILVGLEFGIAVLQAYVFSLLTCIYLNDVLDTH